MSFLNPVNEPVLRFSSTDADAPQINYAARTAGDVKTVLKACLVTGYGDKSSAGWSITNEVDHVAEFVSPSAAMSDYRLGIDDTSTSSTIWYYQYQDARVNPVNNNPTKDFQYTNKTHASNGWQLLVTNRGLIFLEVLYSNHASATIARATYWGAVKGTSAVGGSNIAQWIAGAHAPYRNATRFFTGYADNLHHAVVGSKSTGWSFLSLSLDVIEKSKARGDSTVDFISPLYLSGDNRIIAQYAGVLVNDVAQNADVFGVYDTTLDSRPVLFASLANADTALTPMLQYSVPTLIHLDYWEY